MKVVCKFDNGAIVTQTHAENGSLWLHIGGMEFPLSQGFCADTGELFVQGWDRNTDRTVCINLLTPEQFHAAETYVYTG